MADFAWREQWGIVLAPKMNCRRKKIELALAIRALKWARILRCMASRHLENQAAKRDARNSCEFGHFSRILGVGIQGNSATPRGKQNADGRILQRFRPCF
jgi:hypothetical protein